MKNHLQGTPQADQVWQVLRMIFNLSCTKGPMLHLCDSENGSDRKAPVTCALHCCGSVPVDNECCNDLEIAQMACNGHVRSWGEHVCKDRAPQPGGHFVPSLRAWARFYSRRIKDEMTGLSPSLSLRMREQEHFPLPFRIVRWRLPGQM